MSDKANSIYFTVFAVLYLIYTVVIVGHGLHWSNSMIAITAVLFAVYYYLKDRKNLSKRKGA